MQRVRSVPGTSGEGVGWRTPARWSRIGRWLLVPDAVLIWSTGVTEPLTIAAFAVAVVGLLGIAAAGVVRMLARGRVASGLLGAVLFLAGVGLLALNPVPGRIDGLGDWWPEAITQPQLVASGYWVMASLGVVLAGGGMLVALLLTALLGGSRTRAS